MSEINRSNPIVSQPNVVVHDNVARSDKKKKQNKKKLKSQLRKSGIDDEDHQIDEYA